MTQTLIQKLEALPTESHEFSGEKYVYLDDLRAIIEQVKAEKQEPVAIVQNAVALHTRTGKYNTISTCLPHGTELYTTPQPDIVAELVKALEDSQLETLIENSDGFWVDGEFRIEGSALMSLLRNVAKEMMG